jgi:DNA-binding XRE family transcriptional regulator
MSMLTTQTEKDYAIGLGAWLAEARRRLRMSQDELGGIVGVHRNSVCRWELGQSMPNPYKLSVIKQLVKSHLREKAAAR